MINPKKLLRLPLAGAVLLFAGCDKQTKLTTEKIAAETQKLTVLQEIQARQLNQLQSQMTALGPMLDKMNGAYFQRSYADAFFFHTNTLYLLLAVDRQIESELKSAEAARQEERALANFYHTNQAELTVLSATQIQDALAIEADRTRTNVNAETWRTSASFAKELTKQIQALTPAADEISRRQQLAADLAQIKSDLMQIKARLDLTNSTPTNP